MLRTLCKQFIRPIVSVNGSCSTYRCRNWRLFCSNVIKDDYGGLTANSAEVIKYLQNAKTEYYELVNRRESLGRDGQQKIRELQQMVEIFECRTTAIKNLEILDEEMTREKDSELLALMKDERKV